MASTQLVGDSGKVTLGGAVIAGVTSWSLDIVADTADSTSMGTGGWKDSLTSLLSWSGSCDINISVDDVTNVDATAAGVPIGTIGEVELYADGTGLLPATYTGTVIVTGYSVSSSIGSVITASVSFAGKGAVSGV